TPIYQTSTYRQAAVGQSTGYEYSRTANPTRTALESCLADLEGGARGLAFASGMAALDAVFHLLSPGDHVLAVSDLYGGTYRLLERVYGPLGIETSYFPAADPSTFTTSLRPATRLVLLESPTNPLLHVVDLEQTAAAAHRHASRPWVCVDNTFATPYLQRPIELGADLVIHSTTKYLGGHSDVVGGAIVVREAALGERLAFLQNAVGAIPGPLDAFLTLRGIKTLAVRMDRHGENAQAVAEFLAGQPAIAETLYPGLPSHPQHDLARRQMKNPGGMVSFRMKGGAEAARRVAEATRLFTLAESLGGVESLIEVPAAMTHLSTAGSPLSVDPGLIRLSVGIESASDLIDDLRQALRQA
ncbi:MAG TPA: PLP-dependent transferase, partial [Anaerolineales bacterium]|nr:PLP-dependent transferase [Anaerolineales bacterium]